MYLFSPKNVLRTQNTPLVSADLSALSHHIQMGDRSMTQRGIWVHMSIEAERRSSEPRTIFSQVSEPPANHSPSRKLASLLIGGRDFETSSNSSVLCWYCWRQLLTLTEKVFHFQNKEKYVDISLQDIMFSKKCLTGLQICERSSIWPLGVVKHLGPQWPEREGIHSLCFYNVF